MSKVGYARETHIENGCSLWNDCFTCPTLPDCRCPKKDLIRTPKAEREATRLQQEGYKPEEIAKQLGKSLNTVRRWLK